MRFIAPLAILSSSAATTTGGEIKEEDHKVEAEKLIQRYEVWLEESKGDKHKSVSGAGKTPSRESQLKFAKLLADRDAFVNLSIKDKRVRDEWRKRNHPLAQAEWTQFNLMGSPMYC